MKRLIVLGALCWSCGTPAEPREIPAPPEASAMVSEALPRETKAAPEPAEPADPYAGWKSWCEPFDYDVPCKTAADCVGVAHPSPAPLQCVNPWYAKKRGNTDLLVCAPGYNRKERKWHYARMRELIRQLYFGETKHCKDDVPPAKQHWRCQEPKARGDKLATFLWVAYARETTGRPWKRHRLESDAKANRTSWFEKSSRYGWNIAADKHGEVASMENVQDWANPYYGERYRWHFGLGPIGQNAALWVHRWDVEAPPEILCREVESFESYLRKADEVLVQLKQGIRCGGKPYHDKAPTWTTIHRAANMGSICPARTARHERGIDRFRRDAIAAGLDPDEVVTRSMLGTRIPVDGQNERASEVYAVLESKLPDIAHAK